jgi:hypothetical protein
LGEKVESERPETGGGVTAGNRSAGIGKEGGVAATATVGVSSDPSAGDES